MKEALKKRAKDSEAVREQLGQLQKRYSEREGQHAQAVAAEEEKTNLFEEKQREYDELKKAFDEMQVCICCFVLNSLDLRSGGWRDADVLARVGRACV